MAIWCKPIGIGIIALAGIATLSYAHRADILGQRIRAHVRFLSSDLLEGRGVGSRGGELTEEYLASQLALAGAKPAGDNGTYFQTVPMIGVHTQPDSILSASAEGKEVEFRWQEDFVGASHRQKPTEQFEAEVVFVGHGIVSETEKWNDYKTADVKGKIVLLFTNEPQPDNPEVFKGKALTYAGRWTYKYEEALRQGALGALIIHTTPTAGYGWDVVRNSWSKEDPQIPLQSGRTALTFAGWMTEAAGNKLLSVTGRTVDQLLKASDARDFQPIPLGIKLRGRLNAKLRDIKSRNVLGIIDGNDADLQKQVVMFSAHWDHLGVALPVNGDNIYNGAIDNGTGCGVVLELARAWGTLDVRPRRSALFAFWTAEESGLRGSEYFAQNPIIPPERIAVNINYDAIFPSAQTLDVVVTGAERTTVWPTVQEAARRYRLQIQSDPRPEQGSYYRSDHFMLAKVGIPAFSVRAGSRITGKSAEAGADQFRQYNSTNYHQPSDEYREDWDFASIEHVGRFGFLIGLNIANAEQLPSWKAGDEFYRARP